jgi:hypothetical protein
MALISVHLKTGEVPRIKFYDAKEKGIYWMGIETKDSLISIVYHIEEQDELKNALLNAIKDLSNE